LLDALQLLLLLEVGRLQLMLWAKKKRCKLDGQNRLPETNHGVEFHEWIKHEINAA
jgi:hypothetical protein